MAFEVVKSFETITGILQFQISILLIEISTFIDHKH